MASTEKLPKGMHKFYASDKFTDSCFWFMCGMIYGCDREVYDSANTFRNFMGLDEDSAPTDTLVRKFNRHRKDFLEVIVVDRDKISFTDDDDDFMKKIADEVFRRIKAGSGTDDR